MGRLLHLARRFADVLRARPLGPAEQQAVAALLRCEERPLFWNQTAADQRHAYRGATRLMAEAPGRRDLARAALLHDVGKGAERLSVPGRVAAAALSLLHLPTPGRLGAYLAHSVLGADALQAAGAEPLVVDYARHHHGRRPPSAAPADWDLLARADHL